MAESLHGAGDSLTLAELFQKGWDAQMKADGGELASNSKEFKASVLTGIQNLESATHMANQLSLFSSNEEVEEITTTNLKYLLLPALLGDLTQQVMEGNRIETIQRARVYLLDYLQRCKSYAITAKDPPLLSSPSPVASAAPLGQSLEHMASERTAKIARLRAQKEMEKKLKELAEQLSTASADSSSDEELTREHTFTLLRWWVFKCQDHIRSIDQEAELLEKMEKMRGASGGHAAEQREQALPPHRQPPVPPVMIIRENMKSKVFGAGYPSLPTMMVEEFFEQKYREQAEAHKSQVKLPDSHMPDEDEEREEEEEEESEEGLRKAREWDEFKDDHRRGWGNKKNMG